MSSSPGATQVAGDLVIARDKRLINHVAIEIRARQFTQPTEPTPRAEDWGLGATMAIFTADKQRVRFVNDSRVIDQQVSSDTRELTFHFTPETPTEILGRELNFLGSFTTIAVNFAEVFRVMSFGQAGEPMALVCVIRVNGIEVLSEKIGPDTDGSMLKGQVVTHMAKEFAAIPEVYDRIVQAAPAGLGR